MKRIITLSILLIVCAGCFGGNEQTQEEDKENGPSYTTYQFSHDGQDFKIIPFYDEVLEYIDSMEKNTELDNNEVYTKEVFDPFKETSSLDYITLGNYLSPTSDIEQLEKNTNKLVENQDKINEQIKEAVSESAELLSGADTTFYVFPVNPEDWFTIDNLEGVGGVTYLENDILLSIDPSYSEETLKYTVAHEYHHTVNFFHNGEQSVYSVLDSVITEGKADSFASIIYPDINVSWTEPLSEDAEAVVLEELSTHAESTDQNIFNDFSRGNPAKDIPRWSNYKIGYQITESFIENNPDTIITDWTKLDAKEVVEGSGYSELY
ncbi:DUF2268 domain-containing protein [Lentibacillus amyloliquefaciens]|uniref:DUF2268 domain-containing protein n=1 Tax=Lentibacillus amyloliquefaciens TaxID=1472767 RepID=A0A0U4EYQ9_9BACI|nr:DUF2268 domain-containing putative Zn-dependent protease [Lentibacillus amyloliquefaciens]ALX48455.1 hypothetical protein AOX59_07430 [Lentibacillus amyloliquefaciens]